MKVVYSLDFQSGKGPGHCDEHQATCWLDLHGVIRAYFALLVMLPVLMGFFALNE